MTLHSVGEGADAKKARCSYIITRNKRDFAKSPIPSLTPGEFLTL